MSDPSKPKTEVRRTGTLEGQLRVLPLPPSRYGGAYGVKLLGLAVNELLVFGGQHGDQLTPDELVEIVKVTEAVEVLLKLRL